MESDNIKGERVQIYSSHNGFRIKSEIKLSEYNCNQDLVSGKTENQIGFSISWELEIEKALSIGYKLGFIATSDTHWPNILPGKDRRTVVFVRDLTRKNILDALKKRHNYA